MIWISNLKHIHTMHYVIMIIINFLSIFGTVTVGNWEHLNICLKIQLFGWLYHLLICLSFFKINVNLFINHIIWIKFTFEYEIMLGSSPRILCICNKFTILKAKMSFWIVLQGNWNWNWNEFCFIDWSKEFINRFRQEMN